MIAIVDYGAGNLSSIANMLKKIGAEAQVTRDPAVIATATRLILPGVGAFDHGMTGLQAAGVIPALEQRVLRDKVPLLGLCLGLQLLGRRSGEGSLPGLGWIDAETVRFAPATGLKIPHMGWNRVTIERTHPLAAGLPGDARFYFVHSYHVVCRDPADVLMTTGHGGRFTSAVAHDNILGVQFHPEKSHRYGMELLRNFAQL